MDDPFNLERFILAQAPIMPVVLDELQQGRKRTHWIWFVFPQLAVLGRSATAKQYGLSGRDEARAYLAHPVLRARLIECAELMLAAGSDSITDILGTPDNMKFRSCMTLFAAADPKEPVFRQCLERFFDGEPDPLTLAQLGSVAKN